MDLWQQRFDVLVKQAFGPGARLDGSIGTVSRPGRLEIIVGNKTIGTGGTFQAALQAASGTLATSARATARK